MSQDGLRVRGICDREASTESKQDQMSQRGLTAIACDPMTGETVR
jgi:hypothetical protein